MKKTIKIGDFTVTLIEDAQSGIFKAFISHHLLVEPMIYNIDENFVSDVLLRANPINNAPSLRLVYDLPVYMDVIKTDKDSNVNRIVDNIFTRSNPVYNALDKYHELRKKKQNESVYIALPQKTIDFQTIERIQNACGDIMEVLGYELEQKEEPVLGSFYQRIKFFLSSDKTKAELNEGYVKTKTALEIKYLNLPNAEATEKLANASANLILALQNVDDATLRMGSLLAVKQTKDGKSNVIIETLSPELVLLFDSNPQLLNNPSTIYSMLYEMKNSQNHFKESDGVTLIE